MSHGPYLHERQTEYWTSTRIEEYFLDAGYNVVTVPVSQLIEKRLPADFIFFEKNLTKIFGLQYKALYHNGEEYWPLKEEQHAMLQKYDWIYYCFSELRKASEYRLALYKARIRRNKFPFQNKIINGPSNEDKYFRWEGFFAAFEGCRTGKVISSEEELKHILGNMFDNQCYELEMIKQMIDIFLADLKKKNVLHYSTLLKSYDGYDI